ncbi:MAG: hypothetical protein ACRDO1_12680 [Nocardioidaceae bacterium]
MPARDPRSFVEQGNGSIVIEEKAVGVRQSAQRRHQRSGVGGRS